ncbi:hypothetical protein GCM10009527_077610 [Actinomadura nitritigenes]
MTRKAATAPAGLVPNAPPKRWAASLPSRPVGQRSRHDEELTGLSEFFMRLLYSYLSVPEATGTDPRPFLRRWLSPAVLARAGRTTAP